MVRFHEPIRRLSFLLIYLYCIGILFLSSSLLPIRIPFQYVPFVALSSPYFLLLAREVDNVNIAPSLSYTCTAPPYPRIPLPPPPVSFIHESRMTMIDWLIHGSQPASCFAGVIMNSHSCFNDGQSVGFMLFSKLWFLWFHLPPISFSSPFLQSPSPRAGVPSSFHSYHVFIILFLEPFFIDMLRYFLPAIKWVFLYKKRKIKLSKKLKWQLFFLSPNKIFFPWKCWLCQLSKHHSHWHVSIVDFRA